MVQGFKKIEEKNRVLKSAKTLFDARDYIIDLFDKGTFPYKGNVFKTKEEESEENKLGKKKMAIKNLSNTLRMNQRVLTMNYSKNIFMLQYLMLWQKKYIRQKIKRKIIYLKDETKKDEKETEKPDKTLETVE